MKKYKEIFIILNFILFILYLNASIVKKENILRDGQLILLELAPQDPRSLMQGDYMQLSYKIAAEANIDSIDRRGYCVVKLDSTHVAKLVRFQNGRIPLDEGEHLVPYTTPNKWQVELGAESFFFQEGQADKYAQAKYGGIKVDNKGNSLLVGLYTEKFEKIN